MITCDQFHQIEKNVYQKHVTMPAHEEKVEKLKRENPEEFGCKNNTLMKETLRHVVSKTADARNEEENYFLIRFFQMKLPFKDVDELTLMEHVGPVTIRWYKAGQILYLEGEPFDGVYYIMQGKLVNYSPDVRNGRNLRAFLQGQLVGDAEGTNMRARELSCRAEWDTMAVFVPRETWRPLWAALQRAGKLTKLDYQIQALGPLGQILEEKHSKRLCQAADERTYVRGALICSRKQLVEARKNMVVIEERIAEGEMDVQPEGEMAAQPEVETAPQTGVQSRGMHNFTENPKLSFMILEAEKERRRSSTMSTMSRRSSFQATSSRRGSTRTSLSRQSLDFSASGKQPYDYVKVLLEGVASVGRDGKAFGTISRMTILNWECLVEGPLKHSDHAIDEVVAASINVVCLEIHRDEIERLGSHIVEQVIAVSRRHSVRWESWADLKHDLRARGVASLYSNQIDDDDGDPESVAQEKRERIAADKAYIEQQYWKQVLPKQEPGRTSPMEGPPAVQPRPGGPEEAEEAEGIRLCCPREHEHMPFARLTALRGEAGLPPRILKVKSQEDSTEDDPGGFKNLAAKLQALSRNVEEAKLQQKMREQEKERKEQFKLLGLPTGEEDEDEEQDLTLLAMMNMTEETNQSPSDKFAFSIRPYLDRRQEEELEKKRHQVDRLEHSRIQHQLGHFERDVDVSTGRDFWEIDVERPVLISCGAIFRDDVPPRRNATYHGSQRENTKDLAAMEQDVMDQTTSSKPTRKVWEEFRDRHKDQCSPVVLSTATMSRRSKLMSQDVYAPSSNFKDFNFKSDKKTDEEQKLKERSDEGLSVELNWARQLSKYRTPDHSPTAREQAFREAQQCNSPEASHSVSKSLAESTSKSIDLTKRMSSFVDRSRWSWSKYSTTLASGPSDDMMESYVDASHAFVDASQEEDEADLGVCHEQDRSSPHKSVAQNPPLRPQSRANMSFRAETPLGQLVPQGRLSPSRPVPASERFSTLGVKSPKIPMTRGRRLKGPACKQDLLRQLRQSTDCEDFSNLNITPSKR